jgi:hypothetical protein
LFPGKSKAAPDVSATGKTGWLAMVCIANFAENTGPQTGIKALKTSGCGKFNGWIVLGDTGYL